MSDDEPLDFGVDYGDYDDRNYGADYGGDSDYGEANGDDYGGGKEDYYGENKIDDYGDDEAEDERVGTFRDIERVGNVGAVVDKFGRYLDPKDKWMAEFRGSLRSCHKQITPAESKKYEERLSKVSNLLHLNVELIAKAACYNSIYGCNLTRKNITEYIKSEEGFNPIDVIRYIRFYCNLK